MEVGNTPHLCVGLIKSLDRAAYMHQRVFFAEPRIDRQVACKPILLDVAEAPSKTLIDVECFIITDIQTLVTDGYLAKVR